MPNLQSPEQNDPPSLSVSGKLSGENQMLWTVWLTYGAFYFCRNNLSVALPGIEAELGYDKLQMGIVLLSLKIAYGAGQFINGQLSEQLPPRVMLAAGMFLSAVLNVVFSFGTALYFFLFVWAINGYCQSLGWTPCVRVIGNWIPVHRRGKAIGFVGTGYQLTAGLTYAASGAAVLLFGWRGAMFVPPAILVTAAVIMLLFLRESPPQTVTGSAGGDTNLERRGNFVENMKITLSNPALWILALSLGMLNACRYGFLDWGVSHLYEIEEQRIQESLAAGVSADTNWLDEVLGQMPAWIGQDAKSTFKAAIKYAILPLGGLLGSLIAGWATDRFFGSRRAPVICGLLVTLGCLTLAYDTVARTSFAGTMVLLLFVGFAIYGPQVLLVGTAPADLARRGTSAAAAGFVNCVGYFGAAILGDLLTGFLVKHFGWQLAIYAWAGWAFLAAILVSRLWNASGKDVDGQSSSEAAD